MSENGACNDGPYFVRNAHTSHPIYESKKEIAKEESHSKGSLDKLSVDELEKIVTRLKDKISFHFRSHSSNIREERAKEHRFLNNIVDSIERKFLGDNNDPIHMIRNMYTETILIYSVSLSIWRLNK